MVVGLVVHLHKVFVNIPISAKTLLHIREACAREQRAHVAKYSYRYYQSKHRRYVRV